MIALCLGGANGVWTEYEAAKALIGDRPYITIGCNDAATRFEGHLDAFATLHPELLEGWLTKRAEAGRNIDCPAFSHKPGRGVPAEDLRWRWFGSSGLYTAQVAFDRMCCTHAILCGVPIDDDAGHIHHGVWDSAYHYKAGICEIGPESAKIRSMSGWTREYFGYPDAAWLDAVLEIAA